MIKIDKKLLRCEIIPTEIGYYHLSNQDKILFCSKTNNLRTSLKKLFSAGQTDKNVLQLISLTEKISYKQTDSLFTALLQEKIIRNKHHPQFNNTIRQYEKYVYLALDFYSVPFLKITGHTAENFYYMGPFQSRFFLYDLIDVMANLQKLPSCENETFPCWKLKEKKCPGWCLKEKSEIAVMFFEYYLSVNEDLIAKINDDLQKMQKMLEFEKVEKLKLKQEIIQRYYEHLQFLHVTKRVNLDLEHGETKINICDGMISKIAEGNKIYNFSLLQPEYRLNEFLAHDKSEYLERIIVYRYLSKNKLEQIKAIFKESVLEVKKNL